MLYVIMDRNVQLDYKDAESQHHSNCYTVFSIMGGGDWVETSADPKHQVLM